MKSSQTKIRTYSELIKLNTFEERFKYLQLDSRVGKETFGYDRYLNQIFYKSGIWLKLKDRIIIRDNGCDLGMEGYDIINQPIYIHHMNPINVDDIINVSEFLQNPEYLICTTHNTHNAIHYGNKNNLITLPPERKPFDTCPWRH